MIPIKQRIRLLYATIIERGHILFEGEGGGSHTVRSVPEVVTSNNVHYLPAKTGTFAMLEDLPVVDQTYINGFGHTTTAGSVVIDAGTAYVPGSSRLVSYAGGTVSGAIPNSTTLHLYLLTNGNVTASATPPDAPYAGTARHMTGNINARYLFSVRSRSSGNALYLQRGVAIGAGMDVTFLFNVAIDGVLSNDFGSTSITDMHCSQWAPAGPTSEIRIRVRNYSTVSGVIRLYCYTGAGFTIFMNAQQGETYWTAVPCDGTPRFQADASASGLTCALWVTGYRIVR